LEFEKACRGNLPMVTEEFTWVSAIAINSTITQANLTDLVLAYVTNRFLNYVDGSRTRIAGGRGVRSAYLDKGSYNMLHMHRNTHNKII
jgi:hypothetical protein